MTSSEPVERVITLKKRRAVWTSVAKVKYTAPGEERWTSGATKKSLAKSSAISC
jgi:hypothetical protein